MLFVASLTGACTGETQTFPQGVVGILRVDATTDYVFRSSPSTIGGTCTGWSTISIQKRGQDSTAMNNLMCWKERNGMLYTATVQAEGTTVLPMKTITTPY